MQQILKPLERPDAASEIIELARHHGLSYQRGPLDEWAEAVTRHSGDEVALDDVETLLIALQRAGVVSAYEAGNLHVQYIRQRRA